MPTARSQSLLERNESITEGFAMGANQKMPVKLK